MCGCPSLVSSRLSVPVFMQTPYTCFLLPLKTDADLSLWFSVTHQGLWPSKCPSGHPLWSAAAQPVAPLCLGVIHPLPAHLQGALCSPGPPSCTVGRSHAIMLLGSPFLTGRFLVSNNDLCNSARLQLSFLMCDRERALELGRPGFTLGAAPLADPVDHRHDFCEPQSLHQLQ